MPDIKIQRVVSPPDTLVEAAVALMVAAMADDAGMHAMCGGDDTIAHHLSRAWINEGIKWGEFWTAEENDQLVGFMSWMPPGVEQTIQKDERARVNRHFHEALSEEGRTYLASTLVQEFPKLLAESLGPTGKQDGWWLRIAMVRKGWQGKGIGRKLLEPVRRKASERGESIACSTTTALNVEIYRKLGFELRGSRTMCSRWGEWPLYVLSLRA
ncbi:acyl-CoA N-acyltransferase [Trametes meyenii]|nr:acyl-CoA N-acyltransferase [Trametes meyenii]